MIEQLVVEMQRCHYAWPTPDPKQFQICLWSMWIQCCCQLQQQGGAGIAQKQLDATQAELDKMTKSPCDENSQGASPQRTMRIEAYECYIHIIMG